MTLQPKRAELERLFCILRFVAQQEQSRLPLPPLSSFSLQDCGDRCGTDTVAVTESVQRNENNKKGGLLIIPESLEKPLEEFRMAVTNIPVQEGNVKRASEALYVALRNTYPNNASDLDELCNRAAVTSDTTLNKSSSFLSKPMYALREMHEVFSGLYVGSYHPASDRQQLLQRNVTHILCCIDTTPRFPDTFVYMTLPAQDTPSYNIAKHFSRTFEFIEDALNGKHSAVLVHCGAGISRAPTIVAAYLIKKLRLTAAAAIALIRQIRPVVSPNAGFRRQLLSYQKKLGIAES